MKIIRGSSGWIAGELGRECFVYKDRFYGVGTVVTLYTGSFYGIQKAVFQGGRRFKLEDGTTHEIYVNLDHLKDFTIVEPVYYDIEAKQREKEEAAKPGTKLPPAAVTAIILYVVVMVVGSIFQSRILIYVVATLVLICYLSKILIDKGKNK